MITDTQFHFTLAAQMIREANMIKEQRDKQIAELKALAEQTGETAMHDYEKNVSITCTNWVNLKAGPLKQILSPENRLKASRIPKKMLDVYN